jgi:hypothetical protein
LIQNLVANDVEAFSAVEEHSAVEVGVRHALDAGRDQGPGAVGGSAPGGGSRRSC